MKFFVVCICLFTFLVLPTHGQNVNLAVPIGQAELAETSNSDLIKIIFTVNESESGANSVAIEDFEVMNCTVTDGKNRIESGAFTSPTDRLHPHCSIYIGTGANSLRPDWSKIAVEIKYRYRVGGLLGAPAVFKGISPLTKCLRVSDVVAEIGTGIRTSDSAISVPITLNADLRMNVQLEKTDRTLVATTSSRKDESTVLFENKKPSMVTFTTIPGLRFEDSPTRYRIVINSLVSHPVGTVKVSGIEEFNIRAFVPYRLESKSARSNDDGSATISYSTSTSGSVLVALNDGVPTVIRNGAGAGTFNISSDKLDKGINRLVFSGKSSDGDLSLLADSPLIFVNETKTNITQAPVLLGFDESSNDLKIEFSLSRNINTRWQFKGRNGLGQDVTLRNLVDKRYEASINLNLSNSNTTFVESKLETLPNALLSQAPIEIEIVNATNPSEIIASFKIKFVKPTQNVIAKVKEADALITSKDMKAAARAIAEALGYSPDSYKNNPEQKQIVDSIVPQIKSQRDTKSKVFSVLGIAGKIAAGLFGIPLPF